MSVRWSVLAAGLLLLTGCGEQDSGDSEPEASGVAGLVHLGPQCPVESVDDPCEDQPAANVPVSIFEQQPGGSYTAAREVASGTTDGDGAFRIDVAPGTYIVTAEAGMSCEQIDVSVTEGAYATADVPCDTGIR
jgi:hypothetical protein